MISHLGAAYLQVIYGYLDEGCGNITLMDDAFEQIMYDLSNELMDQRGETDCYAAALVAAGAVFGAEASEIIRTQPAPVAIDNLEKLVSKIKAELQSRIDAARKAAA
ncbi:MAG TPA: hypothetical protein VGI19_14585 [Candidatus Cybelea sp.]